MVQVFDEQQRIILALGVLHGPDPVGVEHGQHDGSRKRRIRLEKEKYLTRRNGLDLSGMGRDFIVAIRVLR